MGKAAGDGDRDKRLAHPDIVAKQGAIESIDRDFKSRDSRKLMWVKSDRP